MPSDFMTGAVEVVSVSFVNCQQVDGRWHPRIMFPLIAGQLQNLVDIRCHQYAGTLSDHY